MIGEGTPRVTVIIPVYNDEGGIGRCVTACLDQTYPRAQYEVLVVDDGSTDRTGERAEAAGARVFRQDNAGPAAARNAGAAQARGELLVFTDADCIPQPDWLECLTAPFSDPQIVGAKGRYCSTQTALVARLVQTEYEEKYDRMARYATIDFIDTYSAVYRREVFLANGGFDPAFPVPSAEDQELSFRLAEQGHTMVFVPSAVVAHRHTDRWKAYVRRKARYGYWQILNRWRHPQTVLRDSHTPQTQKLQIVLITLLPPALLAALIAPALALLPAAVAGAFVASAVPFVRRAAAKGPELGAAALPFLVARAGALATGMIAGMLTIPFRRLDLTPRSPSITSPSPTPPQGGGSSGTGA